MPISSKHLLAASVDKLGMSIPFFERDDGSVLDEAF
jgi:hypothetical protein